MHRFGKSIGAREFRYGRGMRRPLLLCVLALAILGVTAVPALAAPMNCPSTFQVEQNDAIGKVELPAGAYVIKVSDPARLTCVQASQDFAEFLADYDGLLRRPWTVATGAAVFTRGTDSNTAFSVRRVALLPAPTNPPMPVVNPTSNACPGFFSVKHDDHIGALSIPADQYRVTRLDPLNLSCSAAFKQLTRFLQDVDGKLTPPWIVNNVSASFQRGKGSTVGFRIKPAVGRPTSRSKGGQFPAKGQPRECPSTFRVFNPGRVNSLQLPAGRYLTFALKGSGLNCRQVSSLFTRFLHARGQTAPKPWKVNAGNGVFTKGKRPGFRVKPSRPSGSTAR